jgi:crotonobetainyl-CoA:carnitine CoA-transferase CaiB-like acyl-CoA transferase
MSRKHVLDGVKVLDFTHFVAGPHCTRLMAEAGADVIKVEMLSGDATRQLPIIRDGRSGYYLQHNRGKHSLSLDLQKKEAQDICHELAKQSDVVIENFTPGVMKKYNMDWASLSKINPDLIMCSISCLGQDGPLSEFPGYDHIGQAYSGILGVTGEEDGPPAMSGTAFGDVSTGAHAYAAIVSALYHKVNGGGGQYLDMSLLDCLFSYHEMGVQVYDASGGTMMPRRSGHQHALVAPAGLFKCGYRYVMIIAVGRQWESLARLLGRENWLEDPRFADPVSRSDVREEIAEAIEAWLDSVGDAETAVKILVEDNHIPAAPILNVPEVLEHPHMVRRGIVQTVNDPKFGKVKIPASPLRFSQFPEPLELHAVNLGEHNEQILSERLGYSAEQIAGFTDAGVLGNKDS